MAIVVYIHVYIEAGIEIPDVSVRSVIKRPGPVAIPKSSKPMERIVHAGISNFPPP